MDILVGAVIGFGILVAGVVIAPTIKMAMDMAPYLYTNTRCSARAGMLLKKENYDSMLSAGEFREVLSVLEYSNYSYIAEHSEDSLKVSRLLEKDLFDTYDWLSNVVPEKISPIIKAMKIRFEVNQLRDGLNRIKDGKPIGELNLISDPSLRLKLEAAEDYVSFAAALEGTPYGAVFSGKNLSLLPVINTELDRYYYSEIMRVIDLCQDKKAAEPFKDYWRRMIDMANIRLTQRRIGSAIENIELIKGGYIGFAELAGATDDSQLGEVLNKSPYSEFVSDDIESGLYKFLKKDAGLIEARNSLKSGPIVRFIIQKELEVRNLNVLLKLKAEKFPSESIIRYLVV